MIVFLASEHYSDFEKWPKLERFFGVNEHYLEEK